MSEVHRRRNGFHRAVRLAALAAVLIGGCSGEDEMTLRVINQSRWAPSIERAVEEWNATHPGRRVVLDQLVIGYPQLRGKLITAVGGGTAPDLALVDSVWLAEFATAGHLAALDEIDPEWCEKEYKRDFFPAFHRAEFFDGHLWGVRTQTDMALLWYRKDWFEAEGLEPPGTWDELVEIGRRFASEETRRRLGVGSRPLAMPLGTRARETLVYQLLPFFWANGGGVFDEGEVRLDRPQNAETLQFLHDLVHVHGLVSIEATEFEWDRAMKLFAAGRVAMAVGGSYERRLIQEAAGWDEDAFRERVGYALIPSGPRGRATTTAGGMSYVVFRDARDRELALDILELAVSPESMRRFCLETNQHPPRRSVAESLDASEHPFLAEAASYLYRARSRPVFRRYAQMSDVLQEMVEEVVRGDVVAADAVTDAAGRISKLLEGEPDA